MADLVAFLNARLDEDEAAAKAATAGPWEFEGDDPTDDELFSVHDGIVDLTGVTVAFTRDRNVANGQHMARHDPPRALRSVAAVRAILAACRPAAGRLAGRWVAYTPEEWLEFALPVLAAIYNDHPDYREEWRPTP